MFGRAVRIAVLAVGVSLLLLATAEAQSPNPRSTTNVAPRTGSAGGLDAQRRVLFARMLQDPSDLDIAFAYAALSSQMGDLEGAISTLERMLIFAPGLPRLQFELGVLYFRLGAYETAATYFRAVDGAPGVPPDVQSQVTAYLAAVERRAHDSQTGGYVVAGVRYQTNANAGPASPNISLNGLNFTLSPGAVSQPDTNAFIAGTFSALIDIKSQGDRFRISATGYAGIYRTLGQLNTGVVEVQAGPEFNLGRFKIDNATAGIYGIAGGALLGGSPYLATVGIGGDLNVTLDARTSLTIRNEARYETYFDSAARPSASARTGPHLSSEWTLRYQLTPDLDVFATVGVDRRIATTAYLSSWQAGALAGAVFSFASPVASLTQPWKIGVSAGVTQLVGDAPDPVFSATSPERTTRLLAQGKLTVPLPNGFSVEGSATYTRAISNYALSAYDDFTVSIAAGKAF